jgi:hypothetical protein
MLEQYRQLVEIWESNFGRDAGWMGLCDGAPAVLLDDCHWADMFWDTYRVEIVTEDPALEREMLAPDYWRGDGWARIVWGNLRFPEVEVLPHSFPAAGGLDEAGRLPMRSLDLNVRGPWPWEEWWVKRRRKERGLPD